MTAIDEFLKLEGDNYSRKIILQTIDRVLQEKIEFKEIVFNVYSLLIYSERNEIEVCNDIFPDENPPQIFALDEFRKIIEDYKPNEKTNN